MGKLDKLWHSVAARRSRRDALVEQGSGIRSRLEVLLEAHRQPEPVHVIQPTPPSLELFHERLKGVWERRWLSNMGPCHEELEQRIADYLGVQHVCLVSSGTMALLMALQTLGIRDCDVITTPLTFLATTNVLHWVGAQPVFCDVDPATGVIDAAKIEALITPRTRAILAVHVYGHPCQVDVIEDIAERHGLAVVYDAAHAFGARYQGRSLCGFGDISALSFHATKLFSTCEGGALVCRDAATATKLRRLRNFGIVDENHTCAPGINGKMDELSAAYGLLQLDTVQGEIAARGQRTRAYEQVLRDIPGVTPLRPPSGVTANHVYFPVLIAPEYGLSRDRVHQLLLECNIGSRKYFYPPTSHFPWFAQLPSAAPERLPCAERLAEQVLCLPMYGGLDPEVISAIGSLLRELPGAS